MPVCWICMSVLYSIVGCEGMYSEGFYNVFRDQKESIVFSPCMCCLILLCVAFEPD